MKNCYKFKSLISNYIDKQISFRDRRFFESHRENCEDCNTLFASVFKTREKMHHLPQIPVSDEFMSSLRKRILNDRNSRILASQNKKISLNRIPSFAYAFSSVLVLVIIGFFMMKTSGNVAPPTPKLPVTAQKQIDDARKFQQQFDATPAYLQPDQLANTQVDSGLSDEDEPARNFENNLNKVDYQKK